MVRHRILNSISPHPSFLLSLSYLLFIPPLQNAPHRIQLASRVLGIEALANNGCNRAVNGGRVGGDAEVGLDAGLKEVAEG